MNPPGAVRTRVRCFALGLLFFVATGIVDFVASDERKLLIGAFTAIPMLYFGLRWAYYMRKYPPKND